MAPASAKKISTSKKQSADDKLPSSSTKNFFKLEDETTGHLDTQKMGTELKALLGNIRAIMANNASLRKQDSRDNLIVAAAKLRNLNRYSNFRNRLECTKLAETRQKVEEHYLSLQNITNEIAHLRKNIETCLEFQPYDTDIELASIDEFYSNANEELKLQPATTNNDPHQLHLARLNFELNERKSLLANLHELEGRKSALLSDIRGKEQRLCQIQPKIGSIKRTTIPLLDLLGLKKRAKTFVEKDKIGQRFFNLKPIYINEDVCREIFGTHSIELGPDTNVEMTGQGMEMDEPIEPNSKREENEQEAPLLNANLKDFMEWENGIAMANDWSGEHGQQQQHQSRAMEIVTMLRTTMSTLHNPPFESIDDTFQSAITLRRLNRLSQTQNHLKRAKLAEIRRKVEQRSVRLRNVVAKTAFLKNSIQLCLEYESSLENDIELINVEQFYAESSRRPDLIRLDGHQLHSARLRHELATRKSMMEKVQELEREKKALHSSIVTKERILNKVNPRVESLKKIAKPLLDIVGLKSVALSVHNKEIPFRPVPVGAEALREIFDEKTAMTQEGQGMDIDDDEMEEWEREMALEMGEHL